MPTISAFYGIWIKMFLMIMRPRIFMLSMLNLRPSLILKNWR